jgi:sugar phosphate isomerase/epimerase
MARIAMQAYTVRNYGADLEERLALLRDSGFSYLEIGPSLGLERTVELLDRYGMRPVSSGFGVKDWDDEKAVEENFRFLEHYGARGSMNGFFDSEDAQDWISFAERAEEIAQEFLRRRFVFEYHNHEHEYRRDFGGRNALDVLFEAAPSLKYQMDIGWVTAGGADPVAMLDRYRERVTSIHVKDLPRSYVRGSGAVMPDLGEGETPIAQAVRKALGMGVPDLIVENDFPAEIQSFCWSSYRYLADLV